MNNMYKFVFYVPKASAEEVKSAVFATGAGRLGNYQECSFESEGIGQFRPIEGANPSVGSLGELERVEELRVEVLCLEGQVRAAVQAMLDAHPYEEAAFEILAVENAKFGF